MARQYLILHEPVAATRQPPRPGAETFATRSGAISGNKTAAHDASELSVETPLRAPEVKVETLARAEAREMLQKKKVAAIAPIMPMRLVEPVDTRDVPVLQAAAAQSAWGVEAVGALTSPFDGTGIVVAVLDTGIDATHPAFAGVQLEQRNFTDAPAEDQHGHGTHCAGTIFGRPVNGRRIGVAPGVTRAMIGKVLGGQGGGSDQIVKAIEWAVNGGAHVISMSLGIDFPGYVEQLLEAKVPPKLATSLALQDYRANILLFERLASFVAARGLFGQPALLVAAAGNESRRKQSAEFEIGVSPPAVADGIVSVAALGASAEGFTVADFSNTGALVSGPGVDVVSARRGGGLISMDGTSMATPHVAGVAALWAQKLLAEGSLDARIWTAKLVGSGALTKLKVGFDSGDVGSGMVQAPQQ